MNGGCASWYADENGNITTLWPGFTFNFRRQTRKFDVAAYDVAHEQSRIENDSAPAEIRT